jgi:[protein-PII] uridylyltransferase
MTTLDRDALLADTSRTGADWCRAYTGLMDDWLAALFEGSGATSGVALCAVGGYGRAELAPQSDIDVVLLHDGSPEIGTIAERLWYPIWDEGLKLGHAVRTVKEAVGLAASDLDTATSLLSVRHLAGDASLTAQLTEQALALWQKRTRRWLGEVADRVKQRQAKAGEVAFLLEPDLKDGRGGLRDVHAIHWADAADRVMFDDDDSVLGEAYAVLLAARVELHRLTGRPGDTLLLQEQDSVAEALGDADADALMRRVASAARTISWRSDEVWDRISATEKGGLRWRSARDRPLGPGIVLRDGRIAITGEADPSGDPTLPLRVAAAAAQQGVRIERDALQRLAAEAPPLPEPWPPEARQALIDLLLAGRPALAVLESIDQVGLWVQVLPEWGPNRNRPQRNAYHRFTVDRHLFEAVVEASALVDRVSRPDLLALGTLFHDIGKGYPGDHAEVGVELVATIGPRMGYPPDDVAILQTMVREHLLLPDIATRRDLSDEATIRHVAERTGTPEVLRLLGALTEADSLATGTAAWGSWKAELVAELVERTAVYLGEAPQFPALAEFPDESQWALLRAAETSIVGSGDRLTVVVRDRPGLFSRVAGALTLNGLDVLDAAAYTHDNGMALESFRVESSAGTDITWDRVTDDVERALDGQLALHARVGERARLYARSTRGQLPTEAPEVRFDVDISPSATVIEVQAADSIGLLYRTTRALAELDLDIRSAKVQTLGQELVDSFYVVDALGRKVDDPARLLEIERAILHALAE